MEGKEYGGVEENREVLLDFCVDPNGFTREMGFSAGRIVEKGDVNLPLLCVAIDTYCALP
jgi:hypothetical protein